MLHTATITRSQFRSRRGAFTGADFDVSSVWDACAGTSAN